MKTYFKGSYGCTASISKCRDGSFRLRACDGRGRQFHNKTYATYRGARIALGKLGDWNT